MRYFCLVFSLLFLLTSCGEIPPDRLAYQEKRLTVTADFTVNGETVSSTLTLEPPAYDEDGRMLARDALFVIGENSIISGVTFEIAGGKLYVSSGVLRIPLEDETSVGGICDILSLFCISPESFHHAEATELDGKACEAAYYADGANTVTVLLDRQTTLPMRIDAVIDGRELSAVIREITAE